MMHRRKGKEIREESWDRHLVMENRRYWLDFPCIIMVSVGSLDSKMDELAALVRGQRDFHDCNVFHCTINGIQMDCVDRIKCFYGPVC